MFQFELNTVFIQVVPYWMKDILHLQGGDPPRLNSGEFIIIGDQSNGDLLKAAGFYKEGATFDYAVPLGDPDYGPDAFTFYKHPDPEYADMRQGEAMRYSDVLHRVKRKVEEFMRTILAQEMFNAGGGINRIRVIE
jgi:hypothetical protein